MNKILASALGAGLALVSVSAAASEGDNGFFLNAGVGQSVYHVGRTDGLGYKLDEKDTAGALRFGYLWHSAVDFGLEAGYVNLGQLVLSTADGSEHDDLGTEGWLAGVNGRYVFANQWYLSARGGWFRSEARARAFVGGAYGSTSGHGNGWYGGVGVGRDLTRQFSLGLNYDNYHAKASSDFASAHANIGTFMVSAEYRF